MSTDSKSFNEPSMKEQAIAHWEENLRRVKAMNWKEWTNASDMARREVLFLEMDDKHPHIGGDACPYCVRYHWSCKTADGTEQCPLKQGDIPGGCCIAWLSVREALICPWNKVQAVTAIKKMIEYIKEKG